MCIIVIFVYNILYIMHCDNYEVYFFMDYINFENKIMKNKAMHCL